jgi:SAM-dependent methyltransferase
VAERISIVDLGCGLAQQSRALTEFLRDQGVKVSFALVDVETLRAAFLIWWGEKVNIRTSFLPCSASRPIPSLPEMDICYTTEFFEHVHDPLPYFEEINGKLLLGGLLVTGVMDQHAGLLHVSPHLAVLRARIDSLNYTELVDNRILIKV